MSKPKEDSPVTDDQMNKVKAFRRAEDWERLAILEVRVDDHEADIKEIVKNQEKLTAAIDTVNKTLLQIKYVIIGAVGVILTHEMGLLDAVLAIVRGV